MEEHLRPAVLLLCASLVSSFLFIDARCQAAEFVGSAACSRCHESIARSQNDTPMSLTWRGTETTLLPPDLRAGKSEQAEPVWTFELERNHADFNVSLSRGSSDKVTAPIKIVMGGQRHGLSFLASIDQLGGIPLERPALIEARYAWSTAHRQLVLSPGFPSNPPRTLDTAWGIALSPTLEKRCVTCHGEPSALASGKSGGVHCESCHGPGSSHLAAAAGNNPRQGIVNPAKLEADARMAVCAQCHTGFSFQSDPLPDDLLVSNQVNALSNSECFIQSGKRVGCTSCHDPHATAANVAQITVKTCLGCHAAAIKHHAAVCPVNASGECIACHMPSIEKGSFHMVDHWIRIHPEQHLKVNNGQGVDSQVQPLREFVRVISAHGRGEADSAAGRLSRGEAFFDVAREISNDPSAPFGGYLGAMYLSEFDPRLARAAAALRYGQISAPVDLGDHWVIVQRLQRDFKYEAGLLYDQAVALRGKRDTKEALEKYKQSLVLYPNFLRAMIGMGTTLAEGGDLASGAGVLNYAVQTYPKDAEAAFNFALTLGGLGRTADEIAALRRATDLDPDLDAAYENLGAVLSASGDTPGAIEAFRKGLRVDPLSAVLYYDLSLVLAETGDAAGAERARNLAGKIDPAIQTTKE